MRQRGRQRGPADIPKLADSFDGVNIKLMKSGGIQEAWRMIQIAKSLGLGVTAASGVAVSTPL